MIFEKTEKQRRKKELIATICNNGCTISKRQLKKKTMKALIAMADLAGKEKS